MPSEMDEPDNPFFSEVPERLKALISKLADSDLAEPESRELASMLSESETSRLYYLHYLQLHSELSENGAAEGSIPEFESARFGCPNPTPSMGIQPIDAQAGWIRGGWVGIGMGAALSLSLLAAVAWLVNSQWQTGGDPHSVNNSETMLTSPHLADGSSANIANELDTLFVPSEAALSGEDLAVIVRVSPPLSERLIGRRLQAGVLNVEQGEVQIEFMGGAVVALTSPAELKLISNESADLISGVASARVPERARGFTINAPGAAVVDLGTEFVVEVKRSGSSKVRVLDGEVELSLLGDDGNTLTSHRLKSSAEVEFDGSNRNLSAVNSEIVNSPRVVKPDAQPLNVSEAYARMVMESRPIAYWRFETQLDSKDPLRIPNQMGDHLPLHIKRHAAETESVSVADGQLSLRQSKRPRYLITQEPLVPFSADEFTVELWIRPDDLQHATCVAVFPVWSKDADAKLSVIEIVTDTFLIHQPGSIRALYRNPPVQSPDHGINLFTPGRASPGRWQHVAMVKSPTELSLYFDGQLIKTIPSNSRSEDQPFQLHLGQLSLHHNFRQFSGLMDEVAIYNRALTAEDILRRYQLLAKQD